MKTTHLLAHQAWGAAQCLLAGVCWITYGAFARIVQPQYWAPESGLDYLGVAVYSGSLLLTAGGLVALYTCIRRMGRAHWMGGLGCILAIAGATVADIGNFVEDGLGVSVLGGIAYVPGILALLAGLLIASITTLFTRALPVVYALVFILGALALPFIAMGGGIALGGSWLALGTFFRASATGQPGLSCVQRSAWLWVEEVRVREDTC